MGGRPARECLAEQRELKQRLFRGDFDYGESAQQARDLIVEQAKADVEALVERGKNVFAIGGDEGNDTYLGSFYFPDFVVNKEKRTVVAIIKGARESVKVYGVKHRGIAKCDPDDCFNVHIGKAIALRRALGLEVPAEYLNAPQPTEVRVGDVLYLRNIDTTAVAPQGYVLKIAQGQLEDRVAKIIDDSRDGERS